MGRPKLQVNKRTQKTIVRAYTRKVRPLGLVALAEEVKVSIPVIRRILVENKVTIRGRGRPLVKKVKRAEK